MANKNSSGAQHLLDQAADHRAKAAALEAHATTLKSVAGKDGVVGVIEKIDIATNRLERVLRLDPNAETLSELMSIMDDFIGHGKALTSRSRSMRTKIAKMSDAPPAAAKAGGGAKRGSKKALPPPPDDLSALDDPESALASFLEATDYSPSSTSHIKTAWRALVEIAGVRAVDPASLDPQAELSGALANAVANMVRWINHSRSAADDPDPTHEHDESASDGETAAQEPSAWNVESAEVGNGESAGGNTVLEAQSRILNAIAENEALPPAIRVAVFAGMAHLSPLDAAHLRHEHVRIDHGSAVISTEGGDSFKVDVALYEDLCRSTGRRQGPMMVNEDGDVLTPQDIAQQIGKAADALRAVSS